MKHRYVFKEDTVLIRKQCQNEAEEIRKIIDDEMDWWSVKKEVKFVPDSTIDLIIYSYFVNCDILEDIIDIFDRFYYKQINISVDVYDKFNSREDTFFVFSFIKDFSKIPFLSRMKTYSLIRY